MDRAAHVAAWLSFAGLMLVMTAAVNNVDCVMDARHNPAKAQSIECRANTWLHQVVGPDNSADPDNDGTVDPSVIDSVPNPFK
jgi:hypothetical protein